MAYTTEEIRAAKQAVFLRCEHVVRDNPDGTFTLATITADPAVIHAKVVLEDAGEWGPHLVRCRNFFGQRALKMAQRLLGTQFPLLSTYEAQVPDVSLAELGF